MASSVRTIEVFDDLAHLVGRAASEFARRATDAITARGQFAVVLSGGSTPRGLYALLAESPEYQDQIPWKQVHFFWSDERCVPPDHPDSNFGMANAAMLSKLDVPPSNVHRMRGELPGAAAAQQYEDQLRDFFALAEGEGPRFDFVLLGIGADGHTASLFPGSEAVRERRRLVLAPWIAKLNSFRITLTPPALNSAAAVAFLVAGAEKASALKEVLEGSTDIDRLPAQAVQPQQGTLIWFVDRAAASLLHR